MVISQGYFFYRAWSLCDKPLWALFLWIVLAGVELVSGEANFFVTLYKRTIHQTKPTETVDILTSHLTLVAVLDLATSTWFILKLRTMKSHIKRSDKVVRQILLLTIVSNLIFFTLALTTLL